MHGSGSRRVNQCISTTLVLALPEVELEQVGTWHHVEGGGLTAVLQPHQGQAPGAADPGQQPDQLKQITVAWNIASIKDAGPDPQPWIKIKLNYKEDFNIHQLIVHHPF